MCATDVAQLDPRFRGDDTFDSESFYTGSAITKAKPPQQKNAAPCGAAFSLVLRALALTFAARSQRDGFELREHDQPWEQASFPFQRQKPKRHQQERLSEQTQP